MGLRCVDDARLCLCWCVHVCVRKYVYVCVCMCVHVCVCALVCLEANLLQARRLPSSVLLPARQLQALMCPCLRLLVEATAKLEREEVVEVVVQHLKWCWPVLVEVVVEVVEEVHLMRCSVVLVVEVHLKWCSVVLVVVVVVEEEVHLKWCWPVLVEVEVEVVVEEHLKWCSVALVVQNCPWMSLVVS